MVDYSQYEHLKITKSDGVALVTLNRPPHNLLNVKMHREVEFIHMDLERDEEVRAIVYNAEGKNFCAGGDFSLFEANKDDPTKKALSFESARGLVWTMIEMEKPTIAAVHGLATGFGCQMALLCDLVFAADDETTRFSDGHMNIGVAPGDGGVAIWPVLIGVAKAKRYLFTSDPIYAKEAERIGLITEAVPKDKLLPCAMEWATRLANGPTLGVRWAKAAMNQWLRMFATTVHPYAWALQLASSGKPDNLEALKAMAEKRPPKFH